VSQKKRKKRIRAHFTSKQEQQTMEKIESECFDEMKPPDEEEEEEEEE
jgi:hypothetical protein